ncbi:(2Fe-2S) ferredoxin [Deinobacterium chartae]|uniref:(2Fe-2S) ferredoxin n=1 Tax=Deinobacterium chartae TaxID=521158 RepID=A0A841HYV9_9DEIO|nr:(2Fe-2S) ferredoxin domain-containing protein [Deinobacterium chartae]MBB6098731.1 (2Fe-2S) ferredoxin [Deinobacterium chartae]
MPSSGPKFFSTRAHLLLCQNANCRKRGADLLHLGLARALEEQRLMYYKAGGSLRYTTSGCLGACSYGPVLALYRQRPDGTGLEQAWYFGVDFPLALEVARAAHAGTALPQERRYDDGIMQTEPAPE